MNLTTLGYRAGVSYSGSYATKDSNKLAELMSDS